MQADVVVRGGLVFDGGGGEPQAGDVEIRNGRITRIGPDGHGDDVIDARGLAVAPGFIDIHTHFDCQVFWDPALTPSSFHGVTTVVAGNCGYSLAPTRPDHRDLVLRTFEQVEDMNLASLREGVPWEFETYPEYLAAVRARGVRLNFSGFVGHTALRLYVLGDDYERAATDDEVAAMAGLVVDAIAAGARGLATSFGPQVGADGRPVPSRFAARAEFEALTAAVASAGRGIVVCLPAPDFEEDYLYDLQLRTGAAISIVALITMPSGRHITQMAALERGWEKGARVFPQVSPLPLLSEFSMKRPTRFNSNTVLAALYEHPEGRRAAYADPAWRVTVPGAFLTDPAHAIDPTGYRVSQSSAHPELAGRLVQELAAERGTSWLDVLFDLALDEEDLDLRVLAPIGNTDEPVMARLLADERCVVGLSDAGAHVNQLCDAVQPTVLLGEWAREKKALPLETAVRKLSGAQADLLGLDRRGYVREGHWADLVVFDPDTVGPGPKRRVADFPGGATRLTADQPTGMAAVLVNGVPIRRDEAAVGGHLFPGRVLGATT